LPAAKNKKDNTDDLFHSLDLHCLHSPKKSNLLYFGEVLEYTPTIPKPTLTSAFHQKKNRSHPPPHHQQDHPNSKKESYFRHRESNPGRAGAW
jgi:hypothetical protein